jgi:hypothetical protein
VPALAYRVSGVHLFGDGVSWTDKPLTAAQVAVSSATLHLLLGMNAQVSIEKI